MSRVFTLLSSQKHIVPFPHVPHNIFSQPGKVSASLPLLSLSFHPPPPPPPPLLLSPSFPLSYLPFLPITAISPHSLTTLAGVIVVFERTHTVHSIVDLTHHTDGPHVSSSLTTKHTLSFASGGVIEMDGPVANIQTYLSLDNYLNVT